MGEEYGEKVIAFDRAKNLCRYCNVRESCFPHGLQGLDLLKLGASVIHRPPVSRGEHLFFMGEQEDSVYMVRAGTVKTYLIAPNGEEHVLGFCLPGELFGLDAFENEKHMCGAVALEASRICQIPHALLEEICCDSHKIYREMRHLIGVQIGKGQQARAMLAKKRAVARLATFIIDWAGRCRHSHAAGDEIELTMPRRDIASYLELTVESLSRAFKDLVQQKIISVAGRRVSIIDSERIRLLCCPE